MDTVLLLDESTEAALLTSISNRARRIAHAMVRADTADAADAEDLAQDVVLECLVRLRSGKLWTRPASLAAFVRRRVRSRAIDLLRRKKHRAARNAEHARELMESVHAWMSPELALETRELELFREHTLASLPYDCRRAYVMVREGEAPYQVVADQLGVSRAAVCSRVVSAQRLFRRELLEQDIATPPRARGRQKRDADHAGRDADPTRRDADPTRRDADPTRRDADPTHRYIPPDSPRRAPSAARRALDLSER